MCFLSNMTIKNFINRFLCPLIWMLWCHRVGYNINLGRRIVCDQRRDIEFRKLLYLVVFLNLNARLNMLLYVKGGLINKHAFCENIVCIGTQFYSIHRLSHGLRVYGWATFIHALAGEWMYRRYVIMFSLALDERDSFHPSSIMHIRYVKKKPRQ